MLIYLKRKIIPWKSNLIYSHFSSLKKCHLTKKKKKKEREREGDWRQVKHFPSSSLTRFTNGDKILSAKTNFISNFFFATAFCYPFLGEITQSYLPVFSCLFPSSEESLICIHELIAKLLDKYKLREWNFFLIWDQNFSSSLDVTKKSLRKFTLR